MNRCNTTYILALCGLFLLACVTCILALPSSYLFFISRWSNSPDWSPDGEQIAFTCHYPTFLQVLKDATRDPIEGGRLFCWGYLSQSTEICTVHADGSNFTRLIHNQVSDGYPSWSPDGQFIAYLSGSGEGIHVIHKDGSPLRKLAEDLNVSGMKLVWSPDGQRIAFAAKDPTQPEKGDNLYVMTLASESVDALTTFSGDELEACWSPDGTQLAFVWFPEGFKWLASESAAIWISDGEGNNSVLVEGFARIGNLSWNPDGTQLAFCAFQSPDCAYECTEVYVVDVASPTPECLTERYEMDVLFRAAWSPDGTRIAFTAQGPEGTGVYTITPSGEDLSWIAPIGISDHDLAWSPTGEFILFVRGIEGEKSRIWLIQVEGGNLQELNVP